MTGNKSYSTAVLASRAHLLYRINGQTNGAQYWSYALIASSRLEAFKAAIEKGGIQVQDYGRILAWGVGDTPPESVIKDLKLTYNFDIIA